MCEKKNLSSLRQGTILGAMTYADRLRNSGSM